MAKHKDLNNAHAKLFGEGWHIEKHRVSTSSGSRRRRIRCAYLGDSGSCTNQACGYFRQLCYGSNRCESYKRS